MSDYIRCNNSRGRVFFRKCSTFCAIFSRWEDELTTKDLNCIFIWGMSYIYSSEHVKNQVGVAWSITIFVCRYICTNILNLLFKWFWNAIHFSKCVCVWSGYFHKFRYIIIMFFGGVNGWNSNKTHLKCPVVFPTENGVHNFSCVRYVPKCVNRIFPQHHYIIAAELFMAFRFVSFLYVSKLICWPPPPQQQQFAARIV